MWVFVDESGDPGFKFDSGSTTHFVAALVIFDEARHAEQTADAIKSLRNRLRLHPHFEFKFSKLKDNWRLEFVRAIRFSPFRVRAMVVDKRILHSPNLKQKQRFYNYFVGQVFRYHFGSLQNARVRIDGQSGREFQREFRQYVRGLSGGAVADLKFVNSKHDNLIQLADMVAGAVHRAYRDDGRNDSTYLDLLDPRFEDLWEFDKTKRPGT